MGRRRKWTSKEMLLNGLLLFPAHLSALKFITNGNEVKKKVRSLSQNLISQTRFERSPLGAMQPEASNP